LAPGYATAISEFDSPPTFTHQHPDILDMLSLRTLTSAALVPLLVVLVCALLAAFLAYPISWITGDAIGFHSLVNRTGHLLLFLSAVPAAKYFSLNLRDIGAGSKSKLARQAAVGILLGAAMLALHAWALIALGVREIDMEVWANSGHMGLVALKALAIGLIVASVEETIFRGVLFGALRKAAGTASAVAISSFYFALLHFLRSDLRPAESDTNWTMGFRIVGDALGNLSALDPSSFLALFLAGVFLAWIRAAFPAGLGYCIGIHAGWVCIIKTTKAATNNMAGGYWSFLTGSYDGVIGYLTVAWMSVLIALLVIRVRRSNSEKNRKSPDRLVKEST
jgi:membrane protease YdiL (CAAX protease family)